MRIPWFSDIEETIGKIPPNDARTLGFQFSFLFIAVCLGIFGALLVNFLVKLASGTSFSFNEKFLYLFGTLFFCASLIYIRHVIDKLGEKIEPKK